MLPNLYMFLQKLLSGIHWQKKECRIKNLKLQTTYNEIWNINLHLMLLLVHPEKRWREKFLRHWERAKASQH